MYCYLEFKLRYLKNLKLFSIRVKEFFEPLILQKQTKNKKGQVFALFKNIFLRNRSLSNTTWFCSKKHKIGKINLHLTENRLSSQITLCKADNHNYMCHIWAKRIFRFELWLISYWQNINFFTKLPQFDILTKIVIFKVSLEFFLEQMFLPYKFHGRNM